MLEKIKEIAADSLGADVSTMTAETSFKEDLGADSLDLFEMVMALEEEFEVEIPTEDLENIKTIGDVESYLQSRQYFEIFVFRLWQYTEIISRNVRKYKLFKGGFRHVFAIGGHGITELQNGEFHENRSYRITWN